MIPVSGSWTIGVSPCEFPDDPETRMILLSGVEKRMIVASFVSTKHRNVTEDRQTDRQTDGRTDGSDRGIYSGQHSKLCQRAVKWHQKTMFKALTFLHITGMQYCGCGNHRNKQVKQRRHLMTVCVH